MRNNASGKLKIDGGEWFIVWWPTLGSRTDKNRARIVDYNEQCTTDRKSFLEKTPTNRVVVVINHIVYSFIYKLHFAYTHDYFRQPTDKE